MASSAAGARRTRRLCSVFQAPTVKGLWLEKRDAAVKSGGQGRDDRIVAIENGQITRFLVPEEQGLGNGISLEIGIPFQMIGGNVQEGCGVRFKEGAVSS